MSDSYVPTNFEANWREEWQASGLYRAVENQDNPKFYCLDFFPYPSGEGLHVGHCRNYIPTDVLSRYMRMRGYNVSHPMGWDSFGEPTEQYAETHGVHPREITNRSTANFRYQMDLIGTSYDWTREIDSSQPEFYRWTQWFFLRLYKKGLAYRDTSWQWWCPICQTTLSSHESVGGKCWRNHSGIIRREIPAWYFRITDYADSLLEGLDGLDWPEKVKTLQRNWIGRSDGCEIIFTTEVGEPIPVFTTRPETVFGTTFIVLAPEHRLVEALVGDASRAQVSNYREQAVQMSEIDRLARDRQKTGVFSGSYAINPLNQQPLQVWIADYVLPTYGTGAVMGVPAHDERDFEFARKYDLPIQVVISPPDFSGANSLQEAYLESGKMINSGPFDGLQSELAAEQILKFIENNHWGYRAVSYHLRDWLISRQRYWGTPIPIIHCDQCGEVPVPEGELPVLLPDLSEFKPDGSGRSPLARVPEFVNTTCPKCGGPAQRETDTMGGFACSSWYFLRFTSPDFKYGPFNPQSMEYWMPVDLYVGGIEHAVMHLMYARFWTQFLADEGLLPFREPFTRLLNQGQMMGTDGFRMSKSRGNVITPNDVVERYGADTLRVYSLFMAPFDQDVNWSDEGINGARRFLARIWQLYSETYQESASAGVKDGQLEHELHRTIERVSTRIEQFRFNTMISALMEFVNLLSDRYQNGNWQTSTYHDSLETLLVLLAPAAPFISEEIWCRSGHEFSVHHQSWPDWDSELAREEMVKIPVQVNGKVRDVVEVPADARQEIIEEAVFNLEKIQQHIAGSKVERVIYLPGKIMNIVTR